MNSSFVVVLLLQGLFCVSLCLPVDRNPSTKHVEWINEDTRSELLSPIDNLIEPEDYELAEEDQHIEDHQADEVTSEGREASFITGHRIPLELFSSATLRRIELIPEEETPETSTDAGRYINSESFRSGSPPTSPSSTSTSRVEPRPYLLQDDRETLLGAEIDPNYRRTLIKFLPDY